MREHGHFFWGREERRGGAYGSSCCPLRALFSSVAPTSFLLGRKHLVLFSWKAQGNLADVAFYIRLELSVLWRTICPVLHCSAARRCSGIFIEYYYTKITLPKYQAYLLSHFWMYQLQKSVSNSCPLVYKMFFDMILIQVELVVLLHNLKILRSCKRTLKPNVVSRPDLLLKNFQGTCI